MSALDRGFAYGDGVFRTFIARDGAPQHWRRHYVKLAHDCARLGIAAPDEGTLEDEVGKLCSAERDCVIKIIVTRGIGDRGYRPGSGAATRVVMGSALPQYPDLWTEQGVIVRSCNLRLSHQTALAGVKHLNRLENVLARAEWNDPEIAEGILCDVDGYPVSGTMSNVFIVSSGALVTPDLTRCGVAGVTRDRVIEAARRHGLTYEVRQLEMPELRSADELFLVNSVIGVWPVRAFDERVFEVGAVTRRVQKWLHEDLNAQAA